MEKDEMIWKLSKKLQSFGMDETEIHKLIEETNT